MVRNVSRQAAALAQARERRLALDKERDQQDRRVEQATADALVALDEQAEAHRALRAAATGAGRALASLLGEAGGVERAAALVGLGVGEVRRLVKETSGDKSEGGEGAGRRAG